MACAEMLFPGVDDALYARLVQQAIWAGATFDGDRWNLSDLSFSVRRENDVLHLTCYKKPFFVTCGMIQSKFNDLLQAAKEAS